jgi:hypothetical protein
MTARKPLRALQAIRGLIDGFVRCRKHQSRTPRNDTGLSQQPSLLHHRKRAPGRPRGPGHKAAATLRRHICNAGIFRESAGPRRVLDEPRGSVKSPFSDPGGVHVLYTPSANLAHLAHLCGCRISKLLILNRLKRFSEYQVTNSITSTFIAPFQKPRWQTKPLTSQ